MIIAGTQGTGAVAPLHFIIDIAVIYSLLIVIPPHFVLNSQNIFVKKIFSVFTQNFSFKCGISYGAIRLVVVTANFIPTSSK